MKKLFFLLVSMVFAMQVFSQDTCAISTFPHYENFDSYASSSFPTCWDGWNSGTNTTLPSVATDQKYSLPNSLKFGYGAFVVTPQIGEDINLLRIKFMARAEGASSANLEVGLMSDPDDITTFESLYVITPAVEDVWIEHEVYFDQATISGTGKYIAFKQTNAGTSPWYYWLDDVMIDYLPTCLKPQNITFSNITLTSVDISWDIPSTGTPSSYNIQYMPEEETDWAMAQTEVVTTNSITLTGLSPSSVYKVRMQTDCSNEQSDWTYPLTFQTSCEPITSFPFTMDFESSESGTGILPICWVRPTYSHATIPYVNGTSSYAHSGSKSLYFSYSSTLANPYVATPPIGEDLSQLRMKFWARTSTSTGASNMCIGVVSSLTDETTIEFLDTIQITGMVHQEYETLLNTTTITSVDNYIIFKFLGSTVTYVDDITIDYIPTCVRPTDVTISNVQQTTADVSWVDENAGAWNLQYMLASETDWTNATSVPLTSTEYTITELTANTAYMVRVQTDCSSEMSEWTNPITFTTACEGISEFPYTMNFDASATGTGVVPQCWTRPAYSYSTYPYVYNYASYAHSGTNIIYFASGGVNYLITPPIAEEVNSLMVSFYGRVYSTGSGLITVGVISDPLDSTTFEPLTDISVTGSVHQPYEAMLNATTLTGENNYIMFRFSGTTTYVDDIVIDYIPACANPSDIVASNLTATSADISWNDPTGGATSWNLQYVPSSQLDFTLATPIVVTENPYTITGLSANTTYRLRMQTICGDEVSEWSNEILFTTPCVAINEFPYSLDFESFGTGTGIMPDCWIRPTYSYSASYPYVMSSSSYAHSGTKLFYFYSSTTASTYGISPPIGEELNELSVKFWARLSGSGEGLITIGVITNPEDLSTFEPISTVSVVSSTHQSFEVLLNSTTLTGTGKHIVFKHSGTATYIDDITFDYIPTCPIPTNITFSNETTTSADLAWTYAFDNATSWDIEYMPAGQTSWDSATTVVATSSPITLTDLAPSSIYKLRMKTNCSQEEGYWTSVVTFQTECGPIVSFPYLMNFDYETAGSGLVPYCWIRPTYSYSTYPYISTTSANAHSGTQSLYFYTTTTATANNFVITPQIGEDLSLMRVNFWAKTTSTTGGIGTFLIGTITNPTDSTTFEVLGTISVVGNVHQNYEVSFSQTENTDLNNRIAIKFLSGSATSYIDDLMIDYIPTCARPTDLVIDSIYDNGTMVDFSFTPAYENDNSWILYYKPSSSATFDSVVLSDTYYQFTNLTPATNYDVYVATDCSGELSEVSNTLSFQTPCIPLSIPTINEPFNAVPPTTCWAKAGGELPLTGNATLTLGSGSWNSTTREIFPGAGSNARLNVYNTLKGWLLSPSINLGDDGTIAQVELDVFLSDYNNDNIPEQSGADDIFAIVISTDNGLTWNRENAILWTNETDAIRRYDSLYPAQRLFIPLINPSTEEAYQGIVKIGIYAGSTAANADNDIRIDNFVVSTYNTCRNISSLQASPAYNDATVSFNENGEATSWQYVITTNQEATPQTLTPTTITINPFTITELSPQTQYYLYVRSVCEENTYSEWTQTSFITRSLPTTVPYSYDFEDATENLAWGKVNLPASSWATGTAAGNGPTTENTSDSIAMYISQDGGATYGISATTSTFTYTFRDIDFGEDTASYNLSYDWKCQGTISTSGSVTDGLMVFLLDTSIEVLPEFPAFANSSERIALHHSQPSWQRATTHIDNVTGVKRLLFYHWAGSTQYPPQPAIDNIDIAISDCPRPYDLVLSNITPTSVDVAWAETGADSYIVYCGNSDTAFYFASTQSPYSIIDLLPQTQYTVGVKAICGIDTSDYSVGIAFTTPCEALTTFPYYMTFENATSTGSGSMIDCWNRPSYSSNGNYPYINNSESYAHGGTKSMYFYTYYGYNYVATPQIGVDISTLRVKFWARSSSTTTTGNMVVGVMSDLEDSTTFSPISTVVINGTTHQEYEIMLNQSTLTSINNYIVFKYLGTATVYLDDVTIDYIPFCPRPTNISLNNPTPTTIDLSWVDATENATSWNVQYMLASQTSWDNATTINVTTNPTIITGLNVATSYKLRMQADCDTEESEWSSIYTFQTPCYAENVPWAENFDSSSTLPSCSFLLKGTPSIVTAQKHSNPNSLRLEYGGWVTTPAFVEDINALRIRFWARAEGASTGTLEVGLMTDPTDSTTFESLYTIQPSPEDVWIEHEVLFNQTTTTGGNVYVAFKQNNSTNWYWWLDDISVDSIPSCARPGNITFSNETTSTIDVAWNAASETATLWNVQYMPASNTSWDNATTIVANTNPITLTGLAGSSSYKLRIQSDCGDEQSEWSNEVTFQTLCGAITVFPWSENFDNLPVSSFPSCWTRVDANAYTNTTQEVSVPHSLLFKASTRVTTPQIGVDLNSLKIKFMARSESVINSGTLTIGVMSDTADATTFDTILILDPNPEDTWIEYNISFDTTDVSGINKYIAFKQNTTTTIWYWWIDDVEISYSQEITCTSPTNLQVATSNTSATLSWSAGGDETSWQVRLGETGSIIEVATTSYQFTELTSGTTYTAQVRANCEDGYSPWQSIEFTTTTMPPTAITNDATIISQFSATLNGEYQGVSSAPQSKGFEYKLASAENWTIVSSVEGETPFYANVTGLEANSAYVYRAFIVVTGTGTIYGNEISFTTLAIVPPTVTTEDVTNISATSATFTGTVEQGTEELFARGFELKTSTQGWEESIQITGQGTSPFTFNYTSLTENQTYDVRAYVKTGENGQTTTYGEIQNFTTLGSQEPIITLGEVTANSNVLQNSVELLGEVTAFGGANATEVTVGFRYGLESSLTNDVEEVSATLNGSVFSTTLTDLTPATTYYYVSFMTNSAGTALSEIGNFTTNNNLSDNIKSNNVNVVMYPNPAEKETKLVISGVNGKVKISLTDVQGRIINTQTIIVNEKIEQSLDLSNLTKGVYYLQLQGENINRTQKLIVK